MGGKSRPQPLETPRSHPCGFVYSSRYQCTRSARQKTMSYCLNSCQIALRQATEEEEHCPTLKLETYSPDQFWTPVNLELSVVTLFVRQCWPDRRLRDYRPECAELIDINKMVYRPEFTVLIDVQKTIGPNVLNWSTSARLQTRMCWPDRRPQDNKPECSELIDVHKTTGQSVQNWSASTRPQTRMCWPDRRPQDYRPECADLLDIHKTVDSNVLTWSTSTRLQARVCRTDRGPQDNRPEFAELIDVHKTTDPNVLNWTTSVRWPTGQNVLTERRPESAV